MLKILENRLQQHVNHELPYVQAGFRKGRETRDQIANIRWIIKKAKEFQKNIYFCFIDYAKSFDCVDHKKLWKILKEMRIPYHLTCLLRNLYSIGLYFHHQTQPQLSIILTLHRLFIFSGAISNWSPLFFSSTVQPGGLICGLKEYVFKMSHQSPEVSNYKVN